MNSVSHSNAVEDTHKGLDSAAAAGAAQRAPANSTALISHLCPLQRNTSNRIPNNMGQPTAKQEQSEQNHQKPRT